MHVILFKAEPVPGGNISRHLYESTESCESLLQVEWQPDISPQQNIFFPHSKIFSALIMVCKLKSCDVEIYTGMVSSCILAGIFCVVPW